MRALVLIVPVLLLAGCGKSAGDSKDATAITVDAKGEGGDAVAINADGKTGDVSVKVPGFEGKMQLPNISINAADFDIDGVKLYPGSKVSGMHVNADSSKAKETGTVSFEFTSPAEPAKVAAYLRKAFAEKGTTLAGTDTAMTGTKADGDALAISLAAAPARQTTGKISIDGK